MSGSNVDTSSRILVDVATLDSLRHKICWGLTGTTCLDGEDVSSPVK